MLCVLVFIRAVCFRFYTCCVLSCLNVLCALIWSCRHGRRNGRGGPMLVCLRCTGVITPLACGTSRASRVSLWTRAIRSIRCTSVPVSIAATLPGLTAPASHSVARHGAPGRYHLLLPSSVNMSPSAMPPKVHTVIRSTPTLTLIPTLALAPTPSPVP